VTDPVATLQLALLAFVLFAGCGTIAVALSTTPLLDGLARLPPHVAARRLRWLLAAPLLVGVALTVVAFLPSQLASSFDHAHHCTSHGGHPHLCLVHPPDGAAPLGWWALAAVGLFVAARASRLVPAVLRGRRLAAAMVARRDERAPWHRIASDEPVCAAVGWWRPLIVVSDGFLSGVGADRAGAAIAHEQAHVRRRDALWNLAARFFALVLPSPVAERALAALELATERACDEEAALAVKDRLLVADAILGAHRLGLRPPSIAAPGFAPTQWSRRVEALLAAPAAPPAGFRRWDVCAALALSAIVALASPVHHAAETALALLAS
jgi:Zn-dependent protease with chaperone function